jgi:hypothetical protein
MRRPTTSASPVITCTGTACGSPRSRRSRTHSLGSSVRPATRSRSRRTTPPGTPRTAQMRARPHRPILATLLRRVRAQARRTSGSTAAGVRVPAPRHRPPTLTRRPVPRSTTRTTPPIQRRARAPC